MNDDKKEVIVDGLKVQKKIDEQAIKEYEENAKIKYEKNIKPYRQSKYRSSGTQIKCQQCGSPFSLMKHKDEKTGKEFWFCRQCVIQRAKEISKEREGK